MHLSENMKFRQHINFIKLNYYQSYYNNLLIMKLFTHLRLFSNSIAKKQLKTPIKIPKSIKEKLMKKLDRNIEKEA